MTTQRTHPHSLPHLPPVSPPPDQALPTEPVDGEVAALQHELDALRATHERELATLRAEMAAQLMALHVSLTSAHPAQQAAASPSLPVAEQSDSAENQQDERSETPLPGQSGSIASRRALLKWGGLGAAAFAAAAGAASLTSQTAHAADGNNLLLGSASNTAEHITTLTYDGSEATPTVFEVSASANDSTSVLANAGSGVANAAYGVYSTAGSGANSYGVYSAAGTNATGVYGYATGSAAIGAWGATDSGYGVVGSSGSGIDLAASGTGRLLQQTAGFIGAPTVGTYNQGEQIRDALGDLYICSTGGTPGLWKKVAALTTSYQGGAIGFLATPIRVYDSRATAGPLVGNTARTIQVTGVTIGGVKVPTGATGCIGNLTVTGATKSGYVVIYPQGSATPSTSTVNFLAGQTVANAFAVGLSSGGAVTVHSFTSGQCQFIVDITGFVS